LFTVCPKCTLTLVVTTVDLRAGQGYVRCGRCANVFNALIALREGDPANGISDTAKRRLLETAPKSVEPARSSGVALDPTPEPEPEPEPEPPPEPDAATEEVVEETPEEIVLSSEGPESMDAETEGAEPSLEFDASATDVSDIFISPSEAEHDTGSGSYEAVVLAEESAPQPAVEPEPAGETVDDPSHTDTIAADDWSLLDDDEPPADAESVIEESPYARQAVEPAPSSAQPDPPWVEEMFAEAEAQAEATTRRGRTTGRRASDFEVEEEVEAAPAKAPPTAPSDAAIAALHGAPVTRRPRWQYLSGVAVLVVALLFQVAHHNRQNLVLSPSLGPLMSAVYGWFGVTLMPRWDLTAYSVTLLGAKTEGAESTRLRVRLSLQNKSMRVQPLPLLRLTLQDRYGNAVATRDLEPQDYLPKRVADLRLLEPDQRIDTEVHVVDPGKAAEGYVIDACLRGEGGSVGCANDTRRPTVG
jgi:predicted Zn finger-like uncharacterized protein